MTRLRAITLAVLALCIPAGLMAPVNYPEIPESWVPPLRWEYMGLPDPALVARVVLAESSGNPDAVSSKGAVGLMQLMPSLARSLGADPARLHEPDYNLMLGARWLGVLIRRYGVDGALRCYLVGETNKAAWYCREADEYVRRILG